eukprot:CAMPEP_0177435926 /NCGR_PEP_ID=MMETSP0369-20130122/1363_1 /TAXON_ID=447022 ORGANISM="Scrippsiella hangoei-like, Strain SHHI-4" /NCGR_SAMPLE_ID=MMETSP0369 /ASSEMBLY_ACC=CAM_ASM_000364 /LENGTH=57 /DNA_ID=CAMNT_0018907221 /DNA_START=74 /DNA_END=244 /DNA_ORIENTATION=+
MATLAPDFGTTGNGCTCCFGNLESTAPDRMIGDARSAQDGYAVANPGLQWLCLPQRG